MIPERHLVKKGTILYLGHNATTHTCPEKFMYSGQMNSDSDYKFFVGYYTTDENTAEGYARCFSQNNGWVNKYTVRDDFTILDLTDDQLHYDADEVAQEFCESGGGYYIKWSPTVDEFALCNPWHFLQYIGSKQCIGNGKFLPYSCDT